MADLLVPDGDGHTPLTQEDLEGLIPSYIATRGDLYHAEQRNIAHALGRRPPEAATLLDDLYLRALHKTMFGDVWEWAGRYRLRETNLGIDPVHIPSEMRSFVDDVRVWVDNETFEADELAARFHHRLVQIHPFPNGNGRHGRIAADYLLASLGAPVFSWGRNLEVSTSELRHRYHQALRQADYDGEISQLIEFCRT